MDFMESQESVAEDVIDEVENQALASPRSLDNSKCPQLPVHLLWLVRNLTVAWLTASGASPCGK
jgi:hypothetical protein